MKRLILTATLAVGLLAACSPAATPSMRLVTPAPSMPSASGLQSMMPGASGLQSMMPGASGLQSMMPGASASFGTGPSRTP